MAEVELVNIADQREVTNVFTGYRRYRRLPEGAMSESYNMASEEYPAASVRECRTTLFDEDMRTRLLVDCLPGELHDAVQPGEGVNALLCADGRTGSVMYKTRHWSFAAYGNHAMRLLPYGHGFFVPDVRVNGAAQGVYIPDAEAAEARPVAVETNVLCFRASLTDGSGTGIEAAVSPSAPSSPAAGDYWYDSLNNGLYRYANDKWQAVPAYHTRLQVGTLQPEDGFWWVYRGDETEGPTLYRYNVLWQDEGVVTDSAQPPENPEDGEYWYDSARTYLGIYDAGDDAWKPLTYVASDDPPAEPATGVYWIETGSMNLFLHLRVKAWQAFDRPDWVYYEEPDTTGWGGGMSGVMWCDEKTNKRYEWGYYGPNRRYDWTAIPGEWLHFDSQKPDEYVYPADSLAQFRANDFVRMTGDGEVIDVNVSEVKEDYLLIDTLMTPGDQKFLTVRRRMPYLDHAVVHDNRVWGCRYGLNTDGDFVNEIYACRMGDPTNWYSFRGLVEDAYTVSVGEPGRWTGCAVVGDNVVFFKEKCMVTVYGDAPSSYTTALTRCDGIEDGSDRSAVTIDGRLYYKSPRGVMRMTAGSMPELFSDQLGYKDRWLDAAGGTDGRKYYLQMTEVRSPGFGRTPVLYVYDTYLDMWHIETPIEGLTAFTPFRNGLLALCNRPREAGSAEPYRLTAVMVSMPDRSKMAECLYLCAQAAEGGGLIWPDDAEAYPGGYDVNVSRNDHYELDVEWRFATGDYGHDDAEYKRVKSVAVKLWLGINTTYGVDIMYDEDGVWIPLERSRTCKLGGSGTDRVEYRLRRCDLYRLRLHGKGEAVIYSITHTYEEAGDRSYGTN